MSTARIALFGPASVPTGTPVPNQTSWDEGSINLPYLSDHASAGQAIYVKPRQRSAMLSPAGRTTQAQEPYRTNHQPINHPNR